MIWNGLFSFISYYGSKRQLACKYPAPKHGRIIEPFAGSAGYSLEHYKRNITLVDLSPVIYGVWDYLIKVRREEVLRIPVDIESVDELNECQEAKWLVGFWMQNGRPNPSPRRASFGKDRPDCHWGIKIRNRIADQVDCIRHWKIIHGSYDCLDNRIATWFVDPPYNNNAGRGYDCKFSDYESLATWCKQRDGQVIVCENEGADWLPFSRFREMRNSSNQKRAEFIWTKGCDEQKELFS